jgi:xylose isomerase
VYDLFGSIDANQGDPQLGWDTDQFPTDHRTNTLVLYEILKNGGFTTGGFNFDTKLRRQSIDPVDLFYGAISGIDGLAKGLEAAANLLSQKKVEMMCEQRYQRWDQPFGKSIFNADMNLGVLDQQVLENKMSPKPVSGKQELLEILMDG